MTRAAHHTAVVREAMARSEALEVRLAALIEPLLNQVGVDAARRFSQAARVPGLVAAGPQTDVQPTSTMICLKPLPEEAATIADPDGVPVEDVHLTLCYLGELDGDLTPIRDALARVATTHGPLSGVVGGYGQFWPPGVGILLPDVPGLVELRVAVTQALLADGIDYARNHGFTPHLTVDGDPEPDEMDEMLARASGAPLHFESLLIVRGDVETLEVPLVGRPPLTAAGTPADPPPNWVPPAGDEVIDVQAVVAKFRGKTDPVRQAVVESVMKPMLAGAGIAWDATNPLTAGVLAQSGSQIVGIAETTQLNVMRTIKESYEAGLTIPDTAKAIRAGMRDATPARALLIARTELVGAVNGGSLAATQIVASATGETYMKEWLTAPGAPYPRHELYDGLDHQVQTLDGYFDVGGAQLQFPGDPAGPPEEVCNCRCAVAYQTPGGTEEADAEAEGGDLASQLT